MRGEGSYAVILRTGDSSQYVAHDQEDHDEYAEYNVYLDVLEETYDEHVEWPEYEER